MQSASAAAKKPRSSVPWPAWKRSGSRDPSANNPPWPALPEPQAHEGLGPYQARGAAEDRHIAFDVTAQHTHPVFAEPRIHLPGVEHGDPAGLRLRLRARVVALGSLDTQARHVDAEEVGEIGGHGFDQPIDVARFDQGEHRAVNAPLAREVAAARRDQRVLAIARIIDLALQPVDDEALHVEDVAPLAVLGRREVHQQFGVAGEKVRVLAQVRRDVRGL